LGSTYLGSRTAAGPTAPGACVAMAAAGRLSRVRVRCVSRSGAEEETLVVPVPTAPGWTVGNLLERVRQRARNVPAEDLEELELDAAQGGRFFPEDQLEDVLQDGDLLLCTCAQPTRSKLMGLAPREPGSWWVREQAPEAAGPEMGPAAWAQASRNAELEAGYAQVFGEEGAGEDECGESDESPTPPAPGSFPGKGGPGGGSRPSSRAAYAYQAKGAGSRPLARAGAAPGTRRRMPILPASHPGASARSRTPTRRPRVRLVPPLTHLRSADGVDSRDPEAAASAAVPEGREAKWPPLLRAVYEGDLQATEELLRRGADVNCTMSGAGQKTPIYYAIRFEVPHMVRLLLEHPDLDVHREMRSGRGGSWTTPLQAAREAGPSSGVYQAFAEAGLL